MIEEAILHILTTPPGAVAAIVGTHVFPEELPRDPPYPCVVMHVISGHRGYTLDGQDGATPLRFQFDAYDRSVTGTRDLKKALLADLSGFAGDIATSPPVRIHGIFADNEDDSAEPPLEGTGTLVKRKTLDFMVWTKE